MIECMLDFMVVVIIVDYIPCVCCISIMPRAAQGRSETII